MSSNVFVVRSRKVRATALGVGAVLVGLLMLLPAAGAQGVSPSLTFQAPYTAGWSTGSGTSVYGCATTATNPRNATFNLTSGVAKFETRSFSACHSGYSTGIARERIFLSIAPWKATNARSHVANGTIRLDIRMVLRSHGSGQRWPGSALGEVEMDAYVRDLTNGTLYGAAFQPHSSASYDFLVSQSNNGSTNVSLHARTWFISDWTAAVGHLYDFFLILAVTSYTYSGSPGSDGYAFVDATSGVHGITLVAFRT